MIYGQYIQTSDDLTTFFFKKYKKDTDAAFDFIFGTNEWLIDDSEILENVKFKIHENKNVLGNFIGFEKLIYVPIGESLTVSIYLVKYEKQPLWFVFKFYKTEDKWMLYKFNLNENIDEVLDEITKYKLLLYN
jgi:hypothetical protein